MQRHGWTFCLGLLACGLASAQPPANLERYPPAPDLPGVVVGQSSGGKLVSKPTQKSPAVINVQVSEPADAPPAGDDSTPPKGPTITATTLPADSTPAKPEIPAEVAAVPLPEGGCATGCCAGGCLHRIADWLCFRSHARQHGCYPSPYRPLLQAWIPCNAKNGPCPSCMAGKGPVVEVPVIIPAPARHCQPRRKSFRHRSRQAMRLEAHGRPQRSP